nr:nucleolar complex protein 2 homolog isoform X1 [Ipomoea batatas]
MAKKLGKKARKFAKKNLQSVHRRQRKNKVLFKKRSSSKGEQNTAENKAGTRERSNGRNTPDDVFEDTSLDAAFIEDESDIAEDASDSDGYLSEESTGEYATESEPGNALEDNNDASSLSMENRKFFEDLTVKKKKLERLKKKNPDFCKFLERYKDVEVHQKGGTDSDEDEMNNNVTDSVDEDNLGEGNRKILNDAVIGSWRQLVKDDCRESAVVSILNAYRTACHYGAESVPHHFQSSDAFCNLILFVLSEADNLIRGLLQISSSNSEKEVIRELNNTSKLKKAKPLIKSYLRSTLFLLNQVTDSEILAFALTRLRASLVFFTAFPSLLNRLIKTTVHLWATGGGVLSSASFVIIRDAAATFTSDCFENCIVKTFVAYLAQSRVSEVVNVKHMQFLRNSLVDLFSVDVERCSKKAVLSISQLAKVLRWGLHTKKREAVKKICSWEYTNCVDLWVAFISANIQNYDLQPLFFTMVQLINGVACMFAGPRYFPLRLKCIQWLNSLSNSSGTFVPVALFVLDVLEYKIVKEGGKPGNAVNFDSVLKLPKHCLKSRTFQEECVFSAIEQLSAHFAQWSYHISFPELATIPIIRLKKFCEMTSTDSSKRVINRLIDQVEQNVGFVQKKRDEVAFSPNDHQSVELFLQLEKSSLKTAPFTQYYKSVHDKAALRTLRKNEKMSLPTPKRKRGQLRDGVDADASSADKERHNPPKNDDAMVNLKGKKQRTVKA